jgi:hypothetical protein
MRTPSRLALKRQQLWNHCGFWTLPQPAWQSFVLQPCGLDRVTRSVSIGWSRPVPASQARRCACLGAAEQNTGAAAQKALHAHRAAHAAPSAADQAAIAQAAERFLAGKPFTAAQIPGAGRGLVATEAIAAGTRLFSEEPLTAEPAHALACDLCAHCLAVVHSTQDEPAPTRVGPGAGLGRAAGRGAGGEPGRRAASGSGRGRCSHQKRKRAQLRPRALQRLPCSRGGRLTGARVASGAPEARRRRGGAAARVVRAGGAGGAAAAAAPRVRARRARRRLRPSRRLTGRCASPSPRAWEHADIRRLILDALVLYVSASKRAVVTNL